MTVNEAQELAERAIRSAPMTARQAEDVIDAFRTCLELTCRTVERKLAWCERVRREYEARANGNGTRS